MISLSHIFYGILMVGIGVLMMKFNFQLVGITGRQDWIESKLGQGSTFFVFKLFAIALIFLGVLFMSGLDGGFLNWLFSPLRGLFTGLSGR